MSEEDVKEPSDSAVEPESETPSLPADEDADLEEGEDTGNDSEE